MRVLIVNKYHYHRGGAERYHFTLSSLLENAGHEVSHFSMLDSRNERSPSARYFLEPVSHDHPPWHPQAWRAAARMLGAGVNARLGALIDRGNPEIAILGNAYHQLGQPALIGTLRDRSIPMISVLHDFKIVCPAHTLYRNGGICHGCAGGAFKWCAAYRCKGSLAASGLLAIEAYVQRPRWRSVSTFVSPSRYLIEQAGTMGFPYAIEFVRNAVTLHTPVEVEKNSRVGYAGRLTLAKGVMTFIEAARRLPALEFRVVGEGPLRERISARLPANCRVLGRLSPAALNAEMRTWQMAVVPSVEPENSPYAVLEAFAMGLPVVGSAHSGIEELLHERGLLTAAGDPAALARGIDRLSREPELRSAFSQAGHTFARGECSPERFLDRFEHLMKRVLDS